MSASSLKTGSAGFRQEMLCLCAYREGSVLVNSWSTIISANLLSKAKTALSNAFGAMTNSFAPVMA